MTSLTRDEFSKTPGAMTARRERAASEARNLHIMSQAAVGAGNLTGHPAWDTYLTYLQAAIEATETQRATFLEKLADPMMVDHDSMIRAKLGLKECDGRLAAWRSAAGLPKQIIDNGDRARALLEQLPEIGT